MPWVLLGRCPPPYVGNSRRTVQRRRGSWQARREVVAGDDMETETAESLGHRGADPACGAGDKDAGDGHGYLLVTEVSQVPATEPRCKVRVVSIDLRGHVESVDAGNTLDPFEERTAPRFELRPIGLLVLPVHVVDDALQAERRHRLTEPLQHGFNRYVVQERPQELPHLELEAPLADEHNEHDAARPEHPTVVGQHRAEI